MVASISYSGKASSHSFEEESLIAGMQRYFQVINAAIKPVIRSKMKCCLVVNTEIQSPTQQIQTSTSV